eukprot:COSAG03_NODE_4659_length_1476_cov_1.968773_1_plen_89_part_10
MLPQLQCTGREEPVQYDCNSAWTLRHSYLGTVRLFAGGRRARRRGREEARRHESDSQHRNDAWLIDSESEWLKCKKGCFKIRPPNSSLE